MKRHSIYHLIYEFENLYTAYNACKKGQKYRTHTLIYSQNLEENLINLQNHIIWKSWNPGSEKKFVVLEPKRREITAPPFADRVLHHALHQIIEPYFERRFIFDSYACRKGKGVYQACDRLQYFLRAAKRNLGDGFYVVKCDIKSYFASIVHNILINQFAITIKDDDVVDLFKKTISGYGFGSGVGMPVGALTSQLSGNIMLDPIDHKIKDEWGHKYYLRYMDDFVVLVKDKAEAKALLDAIDKEVQKIGLTLNPKSCYFPWQRGVDFCGYRAWPTHRLPRKRTVKSARKRLKKYAEQYKQGRCGLNDYKSRSMSFIAYMNRCQSRTTLETILNES